MCNRIQ